jgi:hypothetical protein
MFAMSHGERLSVTSDISAALITVVSLTLFGCSGVPYELSRIQ